MSMLIPPVPEDAKDALRKILADIEAETPEAMMQECLRVAGETGSPEEVQEVISRYAIRKVLIAGIARDMLAIGDVK